MKIVEKTFDITTGEETIVEREETVAEKKAREKIELAKTKALAESETKIAERQAIADRLGLTAEELQILLG
jgi:hypothetical protein